MIIRPHYNPKLMPSPSERFQRLAHQFEALLESLNESPSSKKRNQLLRRMKILIDEIDGLDLSTLELDEETASSRQPDQSTAES